VHTSCTHAANIHVLCSYVQLRRRQSAGRYCRSKNAVGLGAARHLTIDRHSAVIRKQLDWVVEAADRVFADAFEIEIAFDEVGERAGQQHRSP
jgi:hypothetical protein